MSLPSGGPRDHFRPWRRRTPGVLTRKATVADGYSAAGEAPPSDPATFYSEAPAEGSDSQARTSASSAGSTMPARSVGW